MSYQTRLKDWRKDEKALQSALERLAAAREAEQRDRITSARQAAIAAESAASKAWEALEEERRLYWEQRAGDAQRRLREAALPLIEESLVYRQRSYRPGMNTPLEIVRDLLRQPRPPLAEGKLEVPADSLNSDILDKADEEI